MEEQVAQAIAGGRRQERPIPPRPQGHRRLEPVAHLADRQMTPRLVRVWCGALAEAFHLQERFVSLASLLQESVPRAGLLGFWPQLLVAVALQLEQKLSVCFRERRPYANLTAKLADIAEKGLSM